MPPARSPTPHKVASMAERTPSCQTLSLLFNSEGGKPVFGEGLCIEMLFLKPS